MTVQSLTIDQLCPSPYNVRLNEEDRNATGALEESILETGIWLPFVVHPMTSEAVDLALERGILKQRPRGPMFGVHDGGRRCRAVQRLVKKRKLEPNFAIDCVVRSEPPAKLTELSLGAWLLTRDLREYEVAAAVAKMIASGMSADEVERHLGQQPGWAARQLRLGDLDPAIFAAFAAGTISLDEAKAYAATADTELQRAAFDHFRTAADWNRPEAIRAWLKVGDRELARLLALVGEDVYRAAGGGYELDLFADNAAQRGRVADEGLLRRLAGEALDAHRQALRARAGRPALRFLAEPPKIAGYTDWSLELRLSAEQFPGAGPIALPEGDVAGYLELRDGGEVRTSFWWESRKAQAAARKSARQAADGTEADEEEDGAIALTGGKVAEDAGFDSVNDYTAAQRARAMVREAHGLTADGLQVVRSLRRELLRALLVDDAADGGSLGRDFALWAQLRGALRHDRPQHTGALGLASGWMGSDDAEPRDTVAPHLESCEAHAVWLRALGRIELEDFIALDDPAAGFRAFVDADEEVKLLAGAVLAGLALIRSANVLGWRIPAQDLLARLAGGSDAALRGCYWQPNEDFLAIFPKLTRLELAQTALRAAGAPEDPLRFKALAAGKDAEATREATAILARADWVHPLLSFPPDPSFETEPAHPEFVEREAAE